MRESEATEPAGPPRGRQSLKLLVACVVASGVTVLCYYLMVHTVAGREFDGAAFYGGVQSAHGQAGWLDHWLQRIDEKSLKAAIAVIFAIACLRLRPLLGAAAVLVAGGPVAAAHILRHHVLDRPPFVIGPAADNTFPSDHVAAAVGCALALILVCPPKLRGIATMVGGAFCAAVATQVEVIGWHRASDSIGACIMAFVFYAAAAAVLAWIRPSGQARTRHWWAVCVLAVTALVEAVMAWVAIGRALALNPVRAEHVVDHYAYQAGLDITVGVVALLLGAALLLTGASDFDSRWGTGSGHRQVADASGGYAEI